MTRRYVLSWQVQPGSQLERLLHPSGVQVVPPAEIRPGPNGTWGAQVAGMKRWFEAGMFLKDSKPKAMARAWVESNAKGETEADGDGEIEVFFERDKSHINN